MTAPRPWIVLSDGARPTEDIYLLESAAPVLRQAGLPISRIEGCRPWWQPWRDIERRRLLGSNLVLCRSLSTGWLSWLERHRRQVGRIVYLVDDDIPAAAADATLPLAYRRRMAKVATRQSRLLALADDVVVASQALGETMAHPRTHVLTPPLIASLPTLGHFRQSAWVLGFHGTRAHLADLAHIAPILHRLHDAWPELQLEVMLGRHLPEALQRLPRLHAPAPLSWPDFRHYQGQRRIHIGLAPLLDSSFNHAKSFIKFLDISTMGGVGVYSRRSPYTEIVEHGGTGLLVEDDPEAWYRAVTFLLEHPQEAERMAQAAARVAKERGRVEPAVALWSRLGAMEHT